MKTQTITTPGGERLVLVAEADFARLIEAVEDNSDRAAVDEFRHKLLAGEEELVPSDMAYRLLGGESPVKLWRQHRGMTSATLAEQAGITQGFLSQIETGARDGTVETLRRIADILGVGLDDLAVNVPIVRAEAQHQKIERLIRLCPGLTEAEISAQLHGEHGSQQKVNADCRRLVTQNRVERRGRGGHADPYRYYSHDD